MKNLSKFLCLAVVAMSMTCFTSCSDDDNDNNAVVFNQHYFTKAYTLDEAQTYVTQVAKSLFSSAAVDTINLMNFIANCHDFNDTYLSYKGEAGNVPFDSLVTNIAMLMGGDLSGLSSTLNRYKQMVGSYKANTTTKVWEKTGTKTSSIVLTFPDASGEDITATLAWIAVPDSSTDPSFVDAIYPARPNVITVTDLKGNVVSDTIPNAIQLTIKGGKSQLNFMNRADITVIGSQVIQFKVFARLDDFMASSSMELDNNTLTDNTKFFKNDQVIATVHSETRGNNLLKVLIDPKSYPVSNNKKQIKVTILDKLCMELNQDKTIIVKMQKALQDAGYKVGSKKYAEEMAKAKNEAQSTILYNNADNIYLGSLSVEPYYDTVNQQYIYLPYVTLNNKTTHSMSDFDKGGSGQVLLTGIQTLISRFFGLTGLQEKMISPFFG